MLYQMLQEKGEWRKGDGESDNKEEKLDLFLLTYLNDTLLLSSTVVQSNMFPYAYDTQMNGKFTMGNMLQA